MSNNVLQIKNLHFKYGEKNILNNITFEVKKKEILVILGQSGGGKTTLFKNMLGLVEPYKGTIQIKDSILNIKDKNSLSNYYKKIGVLFQSGALLNSISIANNLKLPVQENTKLDDDIIDIMVKLKLNWFDLKDTYSLLPSELSGGMKKRAAFARAIMLDPEILFLDEPHSGLDPIVTDEVNQIILNVRNAFKTSIVVITHDVNSAMELADRLLILKNGKPTRRS